MCLQRKKQLELITQSSLVTPILDPKQTFKHARALHKETHSSSSTSKKYQTKYVKKYRIIESTEKNKEVEEVLEVHQSEELQFLEKPNQDSLIFIEDHIEKILYFTPFFNQANITK